jgi:hypothetical protein
VGNVKINTEVIDLILQDKALKNDLFIWLVKVTGKRNAFLCGKTPDFPLASEIYRLDLKENYMLFAQSSSADLNVNEIEELKITGDMIERYIPQF